MPHNDFRVKKDAEAKKHFRDGPRKCSLIHNPCSGKATQTQHKSVWILRRDETERRHVSVLEASNEDRAGNNK